MQIYNNIPMPAAAPRGSSPKYPSTKLEVGENYFVDFKDGETDEKACKRAIGGAQRARKADNTKKFAARVVAHPDTGDLVVGVWRIA